MPNLSSYKSISCSCPQSLRKPCKIQSFKPRDPSGQQYWEPSHQSPTATVPKLIESTITKIITEPPFKRFGPWAPVHRPALKRRFRLSGALRPAADQRTCSPGGMSKSQGPRVQRLPRRLFGFFWGMGAWRIRAAGCRQGPCI